MRRAALRAVLPRRRPARVVHRRRLLSSTSASADKSTKQGDPSGGGGNGGGAPAPTDRKMHRTRTTSDKSFSFVSTQKDQIVGTISHLKGDNRTRALARDRRRKRGAGPGAARVVPPAPATSPSFSFSAGEVDRGAAAPKGTTGAAEAGGTGLTQAGDQRLLLDGGAANLTAELLARGVGLPAGPRALWPVEISQSTFTH